MIVGELSGSLDVRFFSLFHISNSLFLSLSFFLFLSLTHLSDSLTKVPSVMWREFTLLFLLFFQSISGVTLYLSLHSCGDSTSSSVTQLPLQQMINIRSNNIFPLQIKILYLSGILELLIQKMLILKFKYHSPQQQRIQFVLIELKLMVSF